MNKMSNIKIKSREELYDKLYENYADIRGIIPYDKILTDKQARELIHKNKCTIKIGGTKYTIYDSWTEVIKKSNIKVDSSERKDKNSKINDNLNDEEEDNFPKIDFNRIINQKFIPLNYN